MVGAHCFAWEREHGPLPPEMKVDHQFHCDTACCEVSHLRRATNAENIRNRRGAWPGRALPRGVYASAGGYYGRAKKDGVTYRTPVRPTIEEAADMIETRRRELYGEFAGGGGRG